jgi:hypothetical protein
MLRLARKWPVVLGAAVALLTAPTWAGASGDGVGNVPQGSQTDTSYAASVTSNGVSNVFATTQKVSCYRPEVPFAVSDAPNDGYSGESACGGTATTGENTGTVPYPTQLSSNPAYPAMTPMLVKDHSESDLRVDPTNADHLIGSSKWFVSPEGYNHLLGFYESFDGGQTWTVQGHIPGYEGWTDNTDPVGAFDAFGNYYEFILAYQFFYNSDGTHNMSIGTPKEPNPGVPAEVVAVAVRPHGSTTATQWITSHNGGPDYVATYDSIGNEPDKQWITIDTNPKSPHVNRIYVMWVDFHSLTPVPMVAFSDANADGTHTDWSAPQQLPMGSLHPQGDTYLLPHVDPNGVVYTTLTNFNPKKGFCCVSIILDKSTDGGNTWSVASTVVQNVTPPPLLYPNTTFRDGIEDTFAVSSTPVKGHYPLYVSWEDFSAGVGNVIMSGSFDGGQTWSAPIQVNDNATPVDELQPNLTVSASGVVSNAFYDRRLACPAAGTSEAIAAGIALDQQNPNYAGSLPPYGASNYCVNASVQYYTTSLKPIGHNVRLTQHTWDPQLNAPHPGSPTGEETFIGDYFGNVTSSLGNFFTFTSTFNDGTNPANRQQQVIARVALPSAH